MRVLLYSEHLEQIKHSGLGKAIRHQQQALTYAQVDYTLDPEDSFDLLHINTYFPRSFFFALKCRLKGIPIVFHAHSTMEDFRNSFKLSNFFAPLFKWWLVACYRLGDVIITPTPYSKQILDAYPINRPIHAISNGIDLSQFQGGDPDQIRQDFRSTYHYQDQDFIVMGIGLYLKRKGILDFVELAKAMPHIQFIWFGELDLRFVPDQVKEAVTTKLDNLKFAGYVPNEVIRQALIATDLYIFPTYEETEGIPAIEAAASHADFIVRDIPVFQDWLEDGRNVYKALDIEDFKEKIQALYDKKLPSLADQAYSIAEERDLPAIGQQLKAVYQEAWQIKKGSNSSPNNPS